MLRQMTAALFVSALWVGLPADHAAAQLRFAAAGGASFPVGSLADSHGTGWHMQVSAGLLVPRLPIALRVDGAYHRFSAEQPAAGAPEPSAFQVLSATANGVYNLETLLLTPYLIGGLGFYSIRDDDREANLGANIGAGVRLGLQPVALFVELRVHSIFAAGDNPRFIPLSVGLHF
jgi:Outer membrane protein beta-barrel domain